MSQALIILKPDCLRRKLVGQVLSIFEENCFDIEKIRTRILSPDSCDILYSEHINKPFYARLKRNMCSGLLMPVLLSTPRDDAIHRVRSLIGHSDPKQAAPSTIRARFGLELPENTIHASDSQKALSRESLLFFIGL